MIGFDHRLDRRRDTHMEIVMLVHLKDLKPNPTRDFKVDPIDDARVEQLRKSIHKDGFWGGIACRKAINGELQIAAGHHRIKAAIKAGLEKADLYVSMTMDDEGMVRVYATENATQRGDSGTAAVGSVAAAVRYLAHKTLIESVEEGGDKFVTPPTRGIEDFGANGVGSPAVHRFLGDVPGLSEGNIKSYLRMLKSSGDYARIVQQAVDDFEAEYKEELKELERAKQAAAKAKDEDSKKEADKEIAKHEKLDKAASTARTVVDKANAAEVTFDYEGVSKHFNNPNQIDAFRECVEKPATAKFLPVRGQAALAGRLVKLAKRQNTEMSARFIRENVSGLVRTAGDSERAANKADRAALAKESWDAKAKTLQSDFARNARGLVKAAIALAKHCKSRPKGVSLWMTNEFKKAAQNARDSLKVIDKVL